MNLLKTPFIYEHAGYAQVSESLFYPSYLYCTFILSPSLLYGFLVTPAPYYNWPVVALMAIVSSFQEVNMQEWGTESPFLYTMPRF